MNNLPEAAHEFARRYILHLDEPKETGEPLQAPPLPSAKTIIDDCFNKALRNSKMDCL